jgi:hypothetical protein
MKDMRAVRFNEKIKRVSTVGSNGALALLITTLSRWYLVGRPDLVVALWIFLTIALMFASVLINDLIASEDE